MEGDQIIRRNRVVRKNFNPLPPHGGRLAGLAKGAAALDFNPLPPHGGRPKAAEVIPNIRAFQSTPSAWRETLRP